MPTLAVLTACLCAAVVARYGWNPSTDTLILVEFAFVLYVAPRVTRRQVNKSLPDLVAAHVSPELAKVVNEALARLPKLDAEMVAAAVRDALAEVQRRAAEGQGDPFERVQLMVRAELKAALDALEAEPIAPEDAGTAMGQKSGESRRLFAAQEEALRLAIQRADPQKAPLLLMAMQTAKSASSDLYKFYVRQGPEEALKMLQAQVGGGVVKPVAPAVPVL